MKLYQTLASMVGSYHRCAKSGNVEWREKWEACIVAAVKSQLPSGSGFDSGPCIDLEKSTEENLFLDAAFHHMNENGFYDGWTAHTVHVMGSLAYGFQLRVTGRDRNEIKSYIGEVFHDVLSREYTVDDAALEAKV